MSLEREMQFVTSFLNLIPQSFFPQSGFLLPKYNMNVSNIPEYNKLASFLHRET